MSISWIFVSGVRLIVPLLLFLNPILGSILGVLSDMTDVVLLEWLGTPNLSAYYNQFDKLFDLYLYLLMAIQAWKSWLNPLAKKTAIGLFVFRAIGVAIYEIFPHRILLFIFPNVFVWFYLFHLFSTQLFKKDLVSSKKNLIMVLILLTIPKLYQEYLFHVVEFPLYQTIKAFLALITG